MLVGFFFAWLLYRISCVMHIINWMSAYRHFDKIRNSSWPAARCGDSLSSIFFPRASWRCSYQQHMRPEVYLCLEIQVYQQSNKKKQTYNSCMKRVQNRSIILYVTIHVHNKRFTSTEIMVSLVHWNIYTYTYTYIVHKTLLTLSMMLVGVFLHDCSIGLAVCSTLSIGWVHIYTSTRYAIFLDQRLCAAIAYQAHVFLRASRRCSYQQHMRPEVHLCLETQVYQQSNKNNSADSCKAYESIGDIEIRCTGSHNTTGHINDNHGYEWSG